MGSLVHKNGISGEAEEQGGAYLTWEEVGVRVNGGSKCILTGVTGYAKPGEIVAIMGPSGSGKSTLLHAFAGRLASNTRHTGQVLINGYKQRLPCGALAYMTQEEVLTWTLTVKEAVYYSAELQLPKMMPKSEKRKRADQTIREMGLQDSLNTRIGGWGIMGLSGGQKRRVSICLQLLTRPKLLLLDEPTSGLDSSASYHVMNQIVKLTQQYHMTVISAIHQPSNKVFGLFDNLCLLSLGRTIYFGPCCSASKFFAENGFPCPPKQNPADHYLTTINTDFDEDIEQGVHGEKSIEPVIEVLVNSYKSSEISTKVQKEIATIYGHAGSMMKNKGSQHASFITQCLVLTERSFVNMYRDLGYYWLRLGIYIVLGFALGTIFYDLGSGFGSINARASMLMFVSSFLTLMAIGGFPSFVEDMKVFQWERLNGHYGVGSFVIGHTLSSTPYLLVISLIPGAIVYSFVGLQRKPQQFIYFALILFVSMLLVECLMMIVATIVPNFLMGIITGAGIQGLMVLSGGFFRLPNDLPNVFWRYPMYHISFHRYVFQGLYKNEFEGLKFADHSGGPPTVDGKMILKDVWQMEMGFSKWIDLAILFVMVIVYRLIFFCSIKTIDRFRNP